jgi:hypothetical protein
VSVPEFANSDPAVTVDRDADPVALVQRLDRWALLFSGLCLIHCLALPLTLTLLPVVGGTALGDHRFHQWLLAVILPTSAVALTMGCRRHGAWSVLTIGVVGLVLLAIAALGHDGLKLSGEQTRWMTIAGGLIVATGHLLNFRRCRALRHQFCGHTHS